MKSNCNLLHLRKIGHTMWLSKTQFGNYAICEHDGKRCLSTTVCGDIKNAENYAEYLIDPTSVGGVQWINDHRWA